MNSDDVMRRVAAIEELAAGLEARGPYTRAEQGRIITAISKDPPRPDCKHCIHYIPADQQPAGQPYCLLHDAIMPDWFIWVGCPEMVVSAEEVPF